MSEFICPNCGNAKASIHEGVSPSDPHLANTAKFSSGPHAVPNDGRSCAFVSAADRRSTIKPQENHGARARRVFDEANVGPASSFPDGPSPTQGPTRRSL